MKLEEILNTIYGRNCDCSCRDEIHTLVEFAEKQQELLEKAAKLIEQATFDTNQQWLEGQQIQDEIEEGV